MAIVFDNVTYLDEVSNATFSIDDGKITGIIGSSYSGKSAIIDLISGLVSSNDIIYDGVDESDIGVLYQDIDDQFFYDKIMMDFYLTLKRHHIKNIDKKMFDSLKMTGLTKDYLYRSPFELSLSEQKRISLALALSFNPKVLLLDEPFFGLDYKEKERCIKLIRMLKIRYGKTIVIASKDSEIIHSLSDKIILINEGRVMKIGSKYDIFTDDKLLKKCNLEVPKVIKFSKLVKDKKGIDIGYRDDVNDLVKDIYRYLR